MNSKHIIMCIDEDAKILKQLNSKISKIIDSNYIVYTYTSHEEALIHSFENIANGYDILMTISSYNFSNKANERFLIDFFRHSPYTKNILFSTNLNTEIISIIFNEASIHRIIEKNLEQYDFELIVLESIKIHDQERRLREYQNILEDAVDKRTQELKDINIRLQVLATTDSLTGIKNRRSFFDSSEPMISYTRREEKHLGVLMLDIDHFKKFNDTYGHAVGDEALKIIVNTINIVVRKSDIVGRVGGEEFAVSLPNTTQEGIIFVANKIREAVEKLTFSTSDKIEIPLRLSIGATIDDLIQSADTALYMATTSGRNQDKFIK